MKEKTKKRANPGKTFEKNFMDSCTTQLENAYIKRYKDDTSGYAGVKNECDLIIFKKKLYLLELKTTKGLTIPLSNLSTYQIEKLHLISKVENTVAGFIINFRYTKLDENLEKTFFLTVDKVVEFINKGERKSITMEYCQHNGLELECIKKRVHYRYNITQLIK